MKRPPSPHKVLSKEALRELRKQQRKARRASARQQREESLAIYRAKSDRELIDVCIYCYKSSCPCSDGELRDQVMKERKLM